MAKVNIGKMACETHGCGNTVTVKENENKTLSYRCDECDAAPYAKEGTGQHKAWRSKLTGSVKNEVPNEQTPETKKDMWGNPV